MDIDDANNRDSNELLLATSSSSSLSSASSLSSLCHHSSRGINRKWKSERSASHRQSIKSSRRVYTDAEIQERKDRVYFSSFSFLLPDHFSLPSQNSSAVTHQHQQLMFSNYRILMNTTTTTDIAMCLAD